MADAPPRPGGGAAVAAPAPAGVADPPSAWSGIVRQLGPGLIITAVIVGSGELIVTPKLGAAAGFSLLWFIILGCILKVFVQIELARFTIATGRTTLQALDTLPGPRLRVSWILWLWALMYVGTVLQVGGIVGGVASVFAELGAGGTPQAWALPVGISCALLLAAGHYRNVERVSTAMVVAFSICTVVAVAALQWTPYQITAGQILHGLTPRMPESYTIAFAAFGVIGVGASELIYYPYWCLEKGYGRRIGPPDRSAEWLARAAGWIRIMRIDAWMSLVFYTGLTAAFYLLGAAVLHARGLAVTDIDLIPTLAHMYRESFGVWGSGIFLAGAFFTLYSTFFVATASNARLFADAAAVAGVRRARAEDGRRRFVRAASVGLPLASTALYLIWQRPVTLIMIGALGQAIMLPFLAYAALHFQRQQRELRIQAGRLWRTGLWASAIAMAVLGLYQLAELMVR